MIKTWFKIFYRNQKKNWLNTLVNVLGLTISLAILVLVLLYYNDEKSYNRTNPYNEEIYRVVHRMSDNDIWTTSTSIEGGKYVEEIPEVTEEYLSRNWYYAELVKIDNKKYYIDNILEGENNFFDFFPFEIIEGTAEKFKESRNNLAIEESTAKKYFGTTACIGKTMEFESRLFMITTVYKITGKHYFQPDMIIQYPKKIEEGRWGSFSHNLLVKTIKGANPNDLISKMDAIWYKYETKPSAAKDGVPIDEWEKKYGTKVLLERLKTIRLETYSDVEAGPEGKGNYQFILIMISLAVLLLTISCVNFINLSLASATQRAKEVGVKKTLGITKQALLFQHISEVLVQGLLAFMFSLLLVELVLPTLNTFLVKNMVLHNEPILLIKVLLISVLLSCIIGYIPALQKLKFKSVEVLKGNITRSKKGILARNIMLGFQFMISGFFLTASIIIYKQVHYMLTKDLGFSGEQVLVVNMNDANNRYKKYLLAKEELIKHPNITTITSNYFVPNGGHSNSTNTNYKEYTSQANGNALDFEYLAMVDIKILKGRELQAKYTSDTINNILVNETMAKELGIYNDPIGKKISVGYGGADDGINEYTIVGMVQDYHVFGLDRKIPPTFFFHWNTFDWMRDYNFYNIQFKITPENIQQTIVDIEKYWKQHVEQDYPFSYSFLDKRFERTFIKYQKQKTLFLILTVIVIVISLLGLFALATLTIQQRLKEVAIRKTLGASVSEIMIQLIKVFLKITVIASIFLIPLSYYLMQHWLDNFVYRIAMPISPYLITPMALTGLVFVVVGIKAFMATKVNLIKYLKFE